MYCPRCGAESKEGSRYCASCGHELPGKGNASPASGEGDGGLRASLVRLIGQDRKARLLTLGTALALVVAVVGFLALDSGDEGEATVPQDAFNRELDVACVRHKGEIAAAQKAALEQRGIAAGAGYAEALVPIVGEWREELRRAAVPADRTELVGDLEGALLEVQIEAGAFARALRERNKAELTESAGNLEAATENVEAAIGTLELERCSRLRISQGRLVGQ
ncbi:MAG TPA: zinc ribbon domain-containing protein [Solirubrobacterales bacterium]